jgi:hypothetical protein
MRHLSISALLLPATLAAAAETANSGGTHSPLAMPLQQVQPAKSWTPPPGTDSTRLVDKVIPAYGMRNNSPHRSESRIEALANEVHAFAGRVEIALMAGSLRLPSPEVAKDEKGKPIEGAPAIQKPLAEEAQLSTYITRLQEASAAIGNLTVAESQQEQAAYSELVRAAAQLRSVGLTQATLIQAREAQAAAAAEASKKGDAAKPAAAGEAATKTDEKPVEKVTEAPKAADELPTKTAPKVEDKPAEAPKAEDKPAAPEAPKVEDKPAETAPEAPKAEDKPAEPAPEAPKAEDKPTEPAQEAPKLPEL